MEPLLPPPRWFRAGRAIARRLPRGRFVLFHALASRLRGAFEDRLGPAAGGYRYRCDPADLVAREVCLTGGYAPQEGALIRASLAAGDTFVDVGANFGYFTLLGAHAVGERGRVIAVEAHPELVQELRANVALNGLTRVAVVHAAALDREGSARLAGFAPEGGNRGVSTLVAGDGAETGTVPGFDVRCATLDALLDAAGVGEVALAKIDVEGAEASVLAGMAAGIGSARYRRILVELHPWAHTDFAATARQLAGTLAAGGYEGWLVDDDPGTVRRAYYGGTEFPHLAPLGDAAPAGVWPHVLWTRGGDDPR
jgi:FkbM family methyltransferase